MREENGETVPATLGEYYDIVHALAPTSAAVRFLEEKIAGATHGRDELVIAADSQMRHVLYPMMAEVVDRPERPKLHDCPIDGEPCDCADLSAGSPWRCE